MVTVNPEARTVEHNGAKYQIYLWDLAHIFVYIPTDDYNPEPYSSEAFVAADTTINF